MQSLWFLQEALTLCFLLLISITIFTDIKNNRIPNKICILLLASGLSYQYVISGWHGVPSAMGGFAVGLVCFLPFYMLKGMGAGDVKMLASIGSFLGPFNTFIAAGFTLIAGIPLAIIIVLTHKQGWGRIKSIASTIKIFVITRQLVRDQNSTVGNPVKFPYAAAIATGTVLVMYRNAQLEFPYLESLLAENGLAFQAVISQATVITSSGF